MYDDTATAKCPCTTVSTCDGLSNICSCAAFCPLYEGTVASYTRRRYSTISPNPSGIDPDYSKMMKWYRNGLFRQLSKVCNDFIIVLELAGTMRPHFHCIFDVRDMVGFNIKMFNESRISNVKIHSEFKKGMHYMFKDIDSTYKNTGVIPILERGDILNDIEYEKDRRREEKLQLILEQRDNYERSKVPHKFYF